MTNTGQLRDLVIEQLLDVHQAQRDQGQNHLYLGVHIEPGVLLAADDVHLPPTTGLLAILDRSEDTAHRGSFLLRVDELFATSSHHRAWSRFNFQLSLAYSQRKGGPPLQVGEEVR